MTQPGFVHGAIDLGAVKEQAERRQQAQSQPAGAITPVVQVTMDNLESHVVQRSVQVPVVVQIGTARSADSEDLKKNFTALAEAGGLKWIFAYIDADTTPQIAQMMGVQGLPTVVVLAGGQPITSFEGGQPAEALPGWIEAILKATDGKLAGLPAEEGEESAEDAPEPEFKDPRVVAIAEQIAAGDVDAAVTRAEELQVSEPHHAEVKKIVAKAHLAKRLVSGSETNPVFAEADQLIAQGSAQQGCELLLKQLTTTFGDEKNAARARLVEVLELFPTAEPWVLDVRRRMASALY